jgi:hypothetical protein
MWNFGKRIRARTGANLQLNCQFWSKTGLEPGLIFRTRRTGDIFLFFF